MQEIVLMLDGLWDIKVMLLSMPEVMVLVAGGLINAALIRKKIKNTLMILPITVRLFV